ncbi:hypothetical protein ACFL42_00425 [Candidatus Omnitrophota bacterium]
MSNKLFLQIVALMIIFAVIMLSLKCMKRSYCSTFAKSKLCAKCTK